MSPIRVTWRRTLGMARNLYSTAFAVAGFLSGAAALLAFNLNAAEGGRLSLPVIWTVSVAPLLPPLAAVLAMDVWSDERLTGRIDSLLSVAVREREYVLGKFLAVWTEMMSTVLFFLVASTVTLRVLAPSAFAGIGPLSFLAPLFALALQGALWCAVSVATSATTCHAAGAAIASVALTSVLPRCVWAALMAWATEGRTGFGEMPLDAHAVDIASGVFSTGTLTGYLVFTAFMLFLASKMVASIRCVGRGATGLRISTGLAVTLASVAAVLAVGLAVRLNAVLEFSPSTGAVRLSDRTRNILAQSGGELQITCFLPRNDRGFRSTVRFLRRLKLESEAVGGARVSIRYVDPRWDIGAAERLIRRGISAPSLVFERGRRMETLPLDDAFGERICASTIRRLTTPLLRRNVYWTHGHGELSFETYGDFGMSDIRRDLEIEGYRNLKIDLSSDVEVPRDCALIIVAGAKTEFSRAELGRLDVYLKQGGRLLVLADANACGVVTLLPSWGLRPLARPISGARTLSGSDVIVSEFSDHAVAVRLRGAQVVLESPLIFEPSAAAEGATGADRLEYSPLASVGQSAVAAVVERGVGAGRDLHLRPTRVIAIGDATFVLNGQLAARANANRDFFMNCIAYLSGTDSPGASGTGPELFVTRLDRASRIRFAVCCAGAIPLAVFGIMVMVVVARRRRR